jgi:NAD(P)-dependent dehydrogenase (short-subunit alcohol dehydrogenase family)
MSGARGSTPSARRGQDDRRRRRGKRAMSRGRFEGQVVLITGASSGIGAGLAREFARRGASVALAARRVDRLEQLAAEIARDGRQAVAIGCDVTRDGDLERAVALARETFGRLDVVVANAGFGVAGPLDRLTLADYRRQFETNVFGVLRTVYAALGELERTRGRLVIIGSVSGHVSMPGGSPYSMSKFALRALAETLWHELRPRGVSVTLISPGFVESEIRLVDNAGVRRERARDPVSRRLVMPTAVAARKIVDAIARRRPEAVITGHGKLAVWLERHVPALVRWGIQRFAMRARPEPIGEPERRDSGGMT